VKDQELKTIRAEFKTAASEAVSFEVGIAAVASKLGNLVSNADNWQMVFDVFYWDWTENNDHIHASELDRISLKYSPFGSAQRAVIREQIRSAEEWKEALEAAGMSPLEALSLAKLDCEMEVAAETRSTNIATSPSPIAIPQEIVMLYRTFYRAAKQYNPERRNSIMPLLLASEVISQSQSKGEDLSQEITGRIVAKMGQIYHGHAKGRWVVSDTATQAKLIKQFADFIVFHVLGERFNGDKASFSSKRGVGLIEDACYALYVLEQDKENRNGGGK
jgi:hypothetical protein